MKTICAWCELVIEDDPNTHYTLAGRELLEHGICSACARKLELEAKDARARRVPACQRSAGL